MDITKVIAEMKKKPGFSKNVGMVLVHNGVARGWSRQDHKTVTFIDVTVDAHRVETLRKEYLNRPGIYEIIIECCSGRLRPGDDLLFIVVAGDIRENVKPVLSELIDRIKAEAVIKSENTSL